MSNWITITVIYSIPLLFILSFYIIRKSRHQKQSLDFLDESAAAGLTEPASLHPVINFGACIGCGSCVTACPEHNVLGLIKRKAHLVNPTNCIGHGACKTACPEDAITLVFGSATRGVDIPEVSEEFETSVKGIYIAGELGGMGLIRNAIEQGRQAMEFINKHLKSSSQTASTLDCMIVGAGPSGLSATLQAMSSGLKTITIDQDSIGGTVAHFPRGKLVMTAPATLPLVGKVNFKEISKEDLMSFWKDIIHKNNVNIQEMEALVDIVPLADGCFEVTTTKNSYHTKKILLTIGRRGSPRKLNVPGEEHPKVTYRMIDPEQYVGEKVLIVGGGDSALEAACSIAELDESGTKGTKVWLSYRSDAFSRAKPKNRARVDKLQAAGILNVLYSSNVESISKDSVLFKPNQEQPALEIPNTSIIVCAGGILPTPFLKKIGIDVATKYGTE
jgi:thioredoxin reductase/ferredoxin